METSLYYSDGRYCYGTRLGKGLESFCDISTLDATVSPKLLHKGKEVRFNEYTLLDNKERIVSSADFVKGLRQMVLCYDHPTVGRVLLPYDKDEPLSFYYILAQGESVRNVIPVNYTEHRNSALVTELGQLKTIWLQKASNVVHIAK